MPSETIYIAGIAVFVVGLLCALGGAPILGIAGTFTGALLWVLAWSVRNAELRNYRAYYGTDHRCQ
ncbi:MAG: hypothetical protein AMJ59_07060 [Gammaproteobacteria bacterium SG8_31]|nr:MAG: hypothetical protein AMJ59_07060 [Gammaproteobacteria bacterium SG8_31]